MKYRKTTTSVCNVMTAVSTRLRCGRFAAAAGLLLLATAGAAWGQPSEVAKLLASDGAANDRLGVSVSISGDTAIVGAPFADREEPPFISNAGSAYIYQQDPQDPDSWDEIAILVADAPFEDQHFGTSVSISGDIAIVGAPSTFGRVFIFYRNQDGPDQWGLVTSFLDMQGNSGFAESVAIKGDLAIVGAPFFLSATGEARIFQRDQGGPDNWGLEHSNSIHSAFGAC